MNNKLLVAFLTVSVLMVSSVAHAATDNNLTNFKIRDVFDSQRILVTDGLADVFLYVDDGCHFTSADLHNTIIVPHPSYQYYDNVTEVYPMIYDTVTYNGQHCEVIRNKFSTNFMRFRIKSMTATTVTGILDNGSKYTLTPSANCDHGSFKLDDYVYVDSYRYRPDPLEDIYLFGGKFNKDTPNESYKSCEIEQSHEDEWSDDLFPIRSHIYEAKLSKRKRPENNRQNYIKLVNRTRRAITTSYWHVLTSDGLRAKIPPVTLKINERLHIYSGTGTNETTSYFEKKVYLGRKRKSLFNQQLDWIQIQDEHNKPVATYYTRYHR